MDRVVGAPPATGPRFRGLRCLAFGLAVLFGVQAAPVPAGAAMQFVAGTCAMTLRARQLSATEIEIRTPVRGTCRLVSEIALTGTASFEANVFRLHPLVPFGCDKIVATSNNGAMFIDGDPEGAWGGDTGESTLTAEAGVVEITLKVGTKLAAVGTFVQTSPLLPANCGTSFGMEDMRWEGVMTFEDPVLE